MHKNITSDGKYCATLISYQLKWNFYSLFPFTANYSNTKIVILGFVIISKSQYALYALTFLLLPQTHVNWIDNYLLLQKMLASDMDDLLFLLDSFFLCRDCGPFFSTSVHTILSFLWLRTCLCVWCTSLPSNRRLTKRFHTLLQCPCMNLMFWCDFRNQWYSRLCRGRCTHLTRLYLWRNSRYETRNETWPIQQHTNTCNTCEHIKRIQNIKQIQIFRHFAMTIRNFIGFIIYFIFLFLFRN